VYSRHHTFRRQLPRWRPVQAQGYELVERVDCTLYFVSTGVEIGRVYRPFLYSAVVGRCLLFYCYLPQPLFALWQQRRSCLTSFHLIGWSITILSFYILSSVRKSSQLHCSLIYQHTQWSSMNASID